MKIIINASNIHVGGGAQVALSFIHILHKFKEHQFFIFASEKVHKQIDFEQLPKGISVTKINFGIREFVLGKTKKVLNLEKTINPSLVFTIFGPSYWTPSSPHLMGFALPWLINPETKAFGELPLKMWFKKKAQNMVKRYLVKKNAKYFVVETEDVKYRLMKFFDIPLSNTWVVDNTYNQHFRNIKIKPTRAKDIFELITITANYPHKNLKIIKEIIPVLKRKGIKARFTLTIPEYDFESMFGDETGYVRNLGPISSKDCPAYYNESDALFLPTLLECFTASYPEAMVMKRPILTSDLPFAKQICKEENALFFDPLNPEDIANQIERLINDNDLYEQLVENGSKRVQEFRTSEQRAEAYIAILEKLGNKD